MRPRWHWLFELVASVALVWLAMVPVTGALARGTQVIVPADFPWAEARVVAMQSPSQPVGLPGTTYAYDITVESMSPISTMGHLTRVNLSLARSR